MSTACPQIKIRTQRRKGAWGAAGQDSRKAVGLQFSDPGGKAFEAKHNHKDKGTDDLDLIFSRPADRGIESGKVIHNRIQIQQAEFFPDRAESEMEPCALGRIKMYFSLTQEI